MRFWLGSVSTNLISAASSFGATWIIVWSFGLTSFAGYAVDLARLSILLLALEVLPSNYSLFRQQTDPQFAKSYPVFYGAAAFFLPLITVGIILCGGLDEPSWFMPGYVALAVVQRYLDCQLQARGKLIDYLRIPALANSIRFLVLAGVVGLGLSSPENYPGIFADLLWGSLFVSLLLSLFWYARRHAKFLIQLVRLNRAERWRYLWQGRQGYYNFYFNSVLKRLKDTALPLVCDALLPRPITGFVLVLHRAVDAAFGQLRILEAVFTNLLVRAQLRTSRGRIAWIAAFFGQGASLAAAGLLMWRENPIIGDFSAPVIFSFAVYPYVAEVLSRSDALAANKPRQVTAALLTYVIVLVGALLLINHVGNLTAMIVGLCFVAAQTASAMTYKLSTIFSVRAKREVK